MAKLIILRGNSGSGKSTLAKMLQRKFGRNTMLVSQDMIRREMLWVRDGAGNPAIPLLIDLLQYGQQHSEVVILEGILYADCYKVLFEAALQAFGQENIFAYYYDLPFEETLARHQTKPNHLDFGEAAMRDWWHEKDYIGFILEVPLTKDISLETAVEMIFATVTFSVNP